MKGHRSLSRRSIIDAALSSILEENEDFNRSLSSINSRTSAPKSCPELFLPGNDSDNDDSCNENEISSNRSNDGKGKILIDVANRCPHRVGRSSWCGRA